MKELFKDTIIVIALFTLPTWFSILLLYFAGANFHYNLLITMLIALVGYSIVFTGVSLITSIIYWIQSKLYKQ